MTTDKSKPGQRPRDRSREGHRGAERDPSDWIGRHRRFGWYALLIFSCLGVALETLHGLKVGWYLDTTNETRRLMWTLAHAHGTLLGLVHIALASSVAAS